MWKIWLQDVEGQIVIPCAETSKDCNFTQKDRIRILEACREEQSIHRYIAQRQHLFTVRMQLLTKRSRPKPCMWLL